MGNSTVSGVSQATVNLPFSTFSSNDRGGLRTLKVVSITAGNEKAIAPEIETRARFKAITSMPGEESLLELARELAEKPAHRDADAIRVEVYTTRFDSRSATARVRKVTEATHSRRK